MSRKRQTKAELRGRTEKFLRALGFGVGTWSWDGATLNVVVGMEVRSLRLVVKETSLARWMFAMGQIKGWSDAGHSTQPHLNGSGKRHEAPAFELHA